MLRPSPLTWSEVQVAGFAGVMRHVVALHAGLKDDTGDAHELMRRHVMGAPAEMAFAKLVDRYWTPCARDHRDLVGDAAGVEVRTTYRQRDPLLRVRRADPDDRPVVLVVGEPPDYRVAGGILAGEAKLDDWWRVMKPGREPCYWVPQEALVDVFDLLPHLAP